jgi:hypothetical protein
MKTVAVHEQRLDTVEADQKWMKRSVALHAQEQVRVNTTIKHALILGQILAALIGSGAASVLGWWLAR